MSGDEVWRARSGVEGYVGDFRVADLSKNVAWIGMVEAWVIFTWRDEVRGSRLRPSSSSSDSL